MSNYQQRDNSGSIFRNEDKPKGEESSKPDYKGKAMIDGVEYYVATWLKTGKSGTKFMSLAFTPVQPKSNAQGGYSSQSRNSHDSGGGYDQDEDAPF